MRKHEIRHAIALAVLGVGLVSVAPVSGAAPTPRATDAHTVAAYWTAARMAAAVPRDIIVDAHGKSMLADANGQLRKYGLNKAVPLPEKGKPGGGGTSAISNAVWGKGGDVKTVAGRLYFVMGNLGYVCSGTTATDTNPDISVIVTAAHCVYDDVAKAFASNVMFIPDLASSGTRTQGSCAAEYVHGCWFPSYGVVDLDWAVHVWPNNIPNDFGVYVVPNSGAHQGGTGTEDPALDALGSLAMEWTSSNVTTGTLTDALGYSYKADPQFMYCEQGLGSIVGAPGYTNRWLSACKLSGGSSGGPWMAAASVGYGPIISVNSWGYQGKPGMAGPNLQTSEPRCVFQDAVAEPVVRNGGATVDCPA